MAVLLGLLLWCLLRPTRPSARLDALESELEEARRRAEEAVLIRSVSKQMEEIAYQQKDLSDRQRLRAEQQARENYRMKLRVEEEWRRAVSSQQEAEKAYRLAESQRKLAEQRRLQAEEAKRKADTLAYQTLGRSLGSIAMTRYRTGDDVTASLLAYAAWLFVKRYGGDTCQSSVFNALSLISGQPASWRRHRAGVSGIACDPSDGHRLYTCGRYGEVLAWTETPDGYDTEVLHSHPGDDFRGACLDADRVLHVLAHDGRLVTFRHPQETRDTGKGKCAALLPTPSGTRLLTQDGRLYDLAGNEMPTGQRTDGNNTLTALAIDPATGVTAWGHEDGTILLTDSKGRRLKKLTGHRSAVTGLALQGGRLYSCSRDRTLRLWNLLEERTEPVTALQADAWLLCLALSPDRRQLFVGDSDGRLYRFSVAPDEMAGSIRQRLPRNFTPQEWKHYMGDGVPYETFIDPKH